MTLKVKNGQLMDRGFTNAVGYLLQYRLPVEVSWNISRLFKQLQKAVKEAGEFYIELLKKHSQLDEQGEFIPKKNEDGTVIPNTYIPKEGEEKLLEEELQKFMSIEVEIKSFPIKLSDLGKVEITPEILSKLEDLIIE